MAEAPTGVPDVHPGIAEIYQREGVALTETLEGPNTPIDAASDIRSLLGEIVRIPARSAARCMRNDRDP